MNRDLASLLDALIFAKRIIDFTRNYGRGRLCQ